MIMRLVSLCVAIVIALVFPLIFDGIGRKIKARIQYRMGPPIFQTIYDVSKLLKTPYLVSGGLMFILAPCIAFASALASITMLPVGGISPISFSYDIFVFLYVEAMVSISLMLAGFSVQNIYANAGANRETMLILSTEPILGVALAMLALLTKRLSIEGIAYTIGVIDYRLLPLVLIAYMMLVYIVYIEGGFIPFDLTEAETEILGGPLCEYSGRLLALFKWALLIKRFTLIWLLASLITIPSVAPAFSRINTVFSYILVLLFQLFIALVLYCSIVANEAFTARYKIDHVISLNKRVFLVSIIFFIVIAVLTL